MGALWIHMAIEIDHANEGTRFFHGLWRSQCQIGRDFLLPGLDHSGREPMAEPFHFFNGPFTFGRVNGEVLVLKTLENFGQDVYMFFPRTGEDANVVNIDFDMVTEVLEDFFHDLLTKIMRLFDTHRQTTVTEFAKRRSNDAKIAGLFIKSKGIETHGNIQLCEIFVASKGGKLPLFHKMGPQMHRGSGFYALKCTSQPLKWTKTHI